MDLLDEFSSNKNVVYARLNVRLFSLLISFKEDEKVVFLKFLKLANFCVDVN